MSRRLLLIHGVGCAGSVWTPMRRFLERAGWTCEAPTLFPEYRLAENPPDELNTLRLDDYITSMSEECRRIREETGEKPVVIGHSMGGLIAQSLVEMNMTSGGVFLTPAQPRDCHAVTPAVAITFLNIVLSQNRSKAHKVWKTGFKWGVLNCVPRARHDEIYATALYDSGKVYGNLADGIVIREERFQVPTLTIAATKDRATPAKAVRKMKDKYARAPVPGDFREYENHAHWILDEPGSDQVAADILDWLELKVGQPHNA